MNTIKLSLLFTFLVAFQLFALRPIDQKLIDAARKDDLQLVDQCIKDGTDVNTKNNRGWTALMRASFWGYTNIVERLLQVPRIDVNIKSNNDWIALMHAAYAGHTNIVERLLQVPEIDVNTKNNDSDTVLHIARKNNKEKVSQLIVDSRHFDIDKFLELITKEEKEEWINYIHEQQKLIAEEKFKKLVQKHKSVINYLDQRELCPSSLR